MFSDDDNDSNIENTELVQLEPTPIVGTGLSMPLLDGDEETGPSTAEDQSHRLNPNNQVEDDQRSGEAV